MQKLRIFPITISIHPCTSPFICLGLDWRDAGWIQLVQWQVFVNMVSNKWGIYCQDELLSASKEGFCSMQLVQRFPNCEAPPTEGALLVLSREGVVCRRKIFILNEVWTEDKNIYFGRSIACLKYFTCKLVPVLAPNYKQHILSSAKVCKFAFFLRHNMPTNRNKKFWEELIRLLSLHKSFI